MSNLMFRAFQHSFVFDDVLLIFFTLFVFEDSMLLEHSFLLVAVSDCIGLVYLRMCTCVNTCVCVFAVLH